MQNNTNIHKKQHEFTEKIIDAVEKVVNERFEYYSKQVAMKPMSGYCDEIINKNMLYNSGIAAASGLLPGPLGYISIIPELVLIVKNQLTMIYDIAFHHEKSGNITPTYFTTLYFMLYHKVLGSKEIVISETDFQKTQQSLQERLTGAIVIQIMSRLGRSMVCRWLPVIGATALAIWAGYETKKLGALSIKYFSEAENVDKDMLFEKEINSNYDNFEDDNLNFLNANVGIDSAVYEEDAAPQSNETDTQNVEKEITKAIPTAEVIFRNEMKIKLLVNLMKSDLNIDKREVEYVETIMANSSLPAEKVLEIQKDLNTDVKFTIDYSPFFNSYDEALALLIDLIALSRRDGQVLLPERYFIEEVARKINVNSEDLTFLMK